MNRSVSTSQRYIGVALLAASLAGVYALGRSQSSKDLSGIPASSSEAASLSAAAAQAVASPASSTPSVEPKAPPAKAEALKAKPAEKSEKAERTAASSPAKPATAAAKPVLCNECATVLSVRQEQRAGEASGLGAVGGAVIGGLLGNQVGGGNGKTLATVGAAAAGGYFGNEMEKKHKAHQVWRVRVAFSDASTRSFEFAHDPGVKVDEVVRVRDGELVRP